MTFKVAGERTVASIRWMTSLLTVADSTGLMLLLVVVGDTGYMFLLSPTVIAGHTTATDVQSWFTYAGVDGCGKNAYLCANIIVS